MRIKVVGNKVYVKGLLEEHQRLSAPPDSLQRPPKSGDQQRAKAIERIRIDKMSVQDVPVGIILEKLAEQLKLDLKIDREALERAGISLKQRVSISVKDATVDELLLEVIKHTPLRFRRRGSVVEIGPAE